MTSPTRRAVIFTAPREVEVVEEPLPQPGSGEVRVETSMSAISPGTERLIYQGNVPKALEADPSIDALSGGLSFPMTYGYAAVGQVEAVGRDVDQGWEGKRVFSFQPHVSHFVASPDSLIPIPGSVRDEDAILIPSLETAVTLLMDGRPMIGERVVLFGQGIVGLLTTALASQFPLDSLLTVEPKRDRRSRSMDWGADQCFDPGTGLDALWHELGIRSVEATEAGTEDGYEGADLVFEVSGTPSVLDDAIAITGYDGRVIVGSWYGEKTADLDLGGRFHRSRMRIRSSQVSSLHPSLRGRWTKDRRLAEVVDLLGQVRPGDLVSDVFSQENAVRVYDRLVDVNLFQPAFQYS